MRSSARPRLLFIALLALAACQGTPPPAPDTQSARAAAAGEVAIRKSPNDARQYRYIELANHLKVLLVSDPDTDKAAASLVVFRGSYNEPPEYPGLAHFLEHMLFIGTTKYPTVDDYSQFISQHGGSTNAYTAGDHTNYFFDIQPEYFDGALDRFAQFFIAPLLTSEYVDREKNAVHSEYQMQLKDDSWRANAVLSAAINPEHPRTRFNIGSLETLGAGVQDALKNFFKTQYSADQMALVAVSNQPLDALEQTIRPLFESIPNLNLGPAAEPPPLFAPGQLPAVLDVQSVKQGYHVSYSFPVPATEPLYAEKPDEYITNLLGHEGEGSLHQLLLGRGWIESLAAGTWEVDERTSMLSIDIDLTPAGYASLGQVTDLLFDAIDRLRAEPPERWRYEEQSEVADLAFRFQEKSSAMGFVYQVGPRFLHYPPRDVLVAPYLMTNFDRGLIEDYLSRLTPENVLMTVSGPDVQTDKRERWFDVPYALVPGALPRITVDASTLALPAHNPFLPENLDVLPGDPAPPAETVGRPGMELWLDRDTEFGTPRANLNLSLGIAGGIVTPRDLAYAELYEALVQDGLSARLYPAYLAGLTYGLSVDGSGLELAVNGYDDKQIELLDVVLDSLKTLPIDPARFAVLRDRLLRDWQNFADERPYEQAMTALDYLLLSDHWPPDALAASLQGATVADLDAWRKQRLAGFNVRALYHGNVDEQDAQALARALEKHLSIDSFERIAPAVATIDASARFAIPVEHDDAAVVIYVQDHASPLVSRARSALAASILRQSFFTSLRTQQQLGYVVAATNQTMRDRGGLTFIIQSPVASSVDLESRIREFLAGQADVVAALPADEFERFRQGLVARLTERDKNLGERGARLWNDLDLGFTSFDSRTQIVAEVQRFTQPEIVDYLRELVSDFDARSLVIYSPGKFPGVPETGAEITDVGAYKDRRPAAAYEDRRPAAAG